MELVNNHYKIKDVSSPWKPQVIESGNPKEKSNVDEFTDHEIQSKK